MRRIIEHGKYRVATCEDGCGCKFSFDLTDVTDGKVECPECGNHIAVEVADAGGDAE